MGATKLTSMKQHQLTSAAALPLQPKDETQDIGNIPCLSTSKVKILQVD